MSTKEKRRAEVQAMTVNQILTYIAREEQFLGDVRRMAETESRRLHLAELQEAELRGVAQSILDHLPRPGRGRPPRHVTWAREVLGMA